MFDRLSHSLQETWDELIYKVTWPSWEQLQESSILVLVASLIIALLIFAMDTAFENVFEVFYQVFE